MEKANERVSKYIIITPILVLGLVAIVAILLLHETQKIEVESFTLSNSLMDKAMQDMVAKLEYPSKTVLTTNKANIQKVLTTNKVEHENDSEWSTYVMTHYGADCNGCSGFTAEGIDVRNTTKYMGYRVLAVDRKVVPLGSIVEINDNGKIYEAIAIDTGGAIKGKKLDLLVSSEKESDRFGVKQIKLKVVREGWQDAKNKI